MATRRDEGPGWVATALGTLLLISVGFGVGLLAGLVWSEPELVVGHLAGRSETVDWDRVTAEVGPEAGPIAAEPTGEPAWAVEEPPAEPVPEAAPALEEAPGAAEPAGSELAAARPAPAPEPPPVAAPPPAAPAPASGGFAVQVGAFADDGAAHRVAEELRAKGFAVYVKPAGSDGRWRVRVGPVASRTEADSLATRLKRGERLPTWVLREGGV